jgi:ribose transport system substrate-binding protein
VNRTVTPAEVLRRHQTIVAHLEERGTATVEELAALCGVSANTIRTDLSALDTRGLLRRVRGGAVAVDRADPGGQSFAARSRSNVAEKQHMARWAAALVQDGEAIILDASTSAYRVAALLRERRHLTVVTNGLQAALLLAQEPTNKVILAANTVRSDGNALVGDLNPDLLSGFRANVCFVSCSAISVDEDLTETDVDEAALKAQLVKLARQVIALVDHTKFERTGAFRFASLSQIDRLVIDEAVAPQHLAALQRAVTCPIVVVGAAGVETITPTTVPAAGRRFRIGFGNLIDAEGFTFARLVRESLERAAQRAGNVELIVRDNALDRQTALANADAFVAAPVDLAIEFQIDFEAGNIIMDRFNRAGIPVVAVDIPLPGATFFGADNYRAGFMAGEGLGRWVAERWSGQVDRVLWLQALRIGPTAHARLQGELEGMLAVLGPLDSQRVTRLDCPVTSWETTPLVADWLTVLAPSERVAVIALNDDGALGALQAFEKAGRLNQVVAVGQGLDGMGRAALRRDGFPFIGSTAYFPEHYGEGLLDTALRILRGEPVPPALYTRHVFVTRENLEQYYPE